MTLEIKDNQKIFFTKSSSSIEIHPFWLRERLNEEEFLDKGTQQRLFDPSSMNSDVNIIKAKIVGEYLELEFNDGIFSKINIRKIEEELSDKDIVKNVIKMKWDSNLSNPKKFEYKEDFFETREMYDL